MPRITLLDNYFGPGFAHVRGRTIEVTDAEASELFKRNAAREPLPEDADEIKRIEAEKAIADETAETAEDAPNGETGDDSGKKKRR